MVRKTASLREPPDGSSRVIIGVLFIERVNSGMFAKGIHVWSLFWHGAITVVVGYGIVSEARSSSIRPMRVWRRSEVTVLCGALILLRSSMLVGISRDDRDEKREWQNGPGSLRIATSTTTQQRV